MNIFVLHSSPIKSAQLQCDKHVVKMIVESGQMLSTAHRILDGTQCIRPSKSGKTKQKYWEHRNSNSEAVLYRAVHVGHPCTVWTMASMQNYIWHYDHFDALCVEYTYRYGKIHATQSRLDDILSVPPANIPSIGLTPFALAMAAHPECIYKDPIQSYRAFYQTKQDRFKMVWSKRNVPSWFKSNVNVTEKRAV
jgi:hypothetical protein|tara:strand:+ start:5980 stop:6561 length:582 start_codon:yes stop_codon:yes gene_type:complete